MTKKKKNDTTDRKQLIARMIGSLGNGQNIQTTFFDWVTMMALAISNCIDLFHGNLWAQREEQYKSIAKKYTAEEMKVFSEAMAYLQEELEEAPQDILGEIYHKLDAQNKRTGQFFTPFHLSLAMAQLQDYRDDDVILNEPTCGAGGMVLAVANIMQQKGINYLLRLKAVAQDIDWNCVYMTYVQLSLAGINAVVIQGNTLTMESHAPAQVFYTPQHMFSFPYHLFKNDKENEEV